MNTRNECLFCIWAEIEYSESCKQENISPPFDYYVVIANLCTICGLKRKNSCDNHRTPKIGQTEISVGPLRRFVRIPLFWFSHFLKVYEDSSSLSLQGRMNVYTNHFA